MLVALLAAAPSQLTSPGAASPGVASLLLPGDPIALRVSIVNNAAADGLFLNSKTSKLLHGNFTSAPPDEIAQYGAPGAYNYGYALKPDVSGAISATQTYASNTSGGAYAVIYAFAKDPVLPGVFGVQVNSNMHQATISLYSALFGDGPTTEVDIMVHVDPPAA